MKARKVKADDARLVLTRMALDKAVVASVADSWTKDGLFDSRSENLVGKWCVEHYREFNEPAGRAIGTYFGRWAERQTDDAVTEFVGNFLQSLSDEADRRGGSVSSEFAIDVAQRVFDAARIRKLRDECGAALEMGDVERARELVEKAARPLTVSADNGFLPFAGGHEIINAIESQSEVLFDWGNEALDSLFAGVFARDVLVAFQAPAKMGKCLDGGCEVVFADGRVRTVREVYESKDNGKLLSFDTSARKTVHVSASAFYDNGMKPCYELTTFSGRKVTTTANHKYYTPSGWKELKDISQGEYVAVPRRVVTFGSKEMDRRELRFLAYMLAEGCCVQTYWKGAAVGCACMFTNADPLLQKDFEECAAALRIGAKKRGITYGLSGEARRILRRHGMLGHSAKTKTIPDAVFTCTKRQVAEFLRVFFSCDGSIQPKRRVIELTLANERLIRQISHLLHRFGILHTVREKPSKYNGKTFAAWRILIGSVEHVNKFLSEINFLSGKKTGVFASASERSFLDCLPATEALGLYEAYKAECGGARHVGRGPSDPTGFYATLGRKRAMTIKSSVHRRGTSLCKQTFAPIRKSASYLHYFGSDMMWEKVTEIKCVGRRQTYDLAIPKTHNFVANDCIVHNSFFVQEVAFRAYRNLCNVAFFEVGDQSKRQILRRFAARAYRRPYKPDTRVRYPKSIVPAEKPGQMPTVEFEESAYENAMTGDEADRAVQRWGREFGVDNFRMAVYPNFSVSARGIEAQLERWNDFDNFRPDVLCLDYADILAPLDGKAETRDQINQTWMHLRAMSERWRCCVVTATQSDADGYTAESLSMRNFSNDRRKNDHVVYLFGVMQKPEEKDAQLYRVNCIAGREIEFSHDKHLWVANCLACANPAVLACW